jgi:hypothetical protein
VEREIALMWIYPGELGLFERNVFLREARAAE